MKFFVRTPIDEPVEIDVDPNVTSEQLKVILMAKYGFQMGEYRFVYGGKIIKEKYPLKSIPERSLIIISIKQHQNMEIEKPPPKVNLHTVHFDIPPNINETKALYEAHIQEINMRSPIILTQSNKNDIDHTIKHLFIKNAYMHNFIDHPEEAIKVSDILERSPGVWSYLTDFEMQHFSNSLYHSPVPETHPLVLTGIQLPKGNNLIPDFDACIMSLPKQKRIEFEKVAQAAPNKEIALKIFIEHNLDVQSSLEIIEAINKRK